MITGKVFYIIAGPGLFLLSGTTEAKKGVNVFYTVSHKLEARDNREVVSDERVGGTSGDYVFVDDDAEGLDMDIDESEVASDSVITELPDSVKDEIRTIMAMPLSHIKINSPFGVRRDPLNRRKKRVHNGLDLQARYEKVYSMFSGTVKDVGYSRAAGYYVTLDHGVCTVSYCHLSKPLVVKGWSVKAGDVVAISGNSGARTTGPHLHITCRYTDGQKQYFNPLLLFSFACSYAPYSQK